jgi:CRISPR type IV-associated protein Csf2
MRTYVFEGTMTALSSISHNGGQSFGVNSKLRREKFVQPNGSVEEVPIISGNGLRGMLRDRGMLHMCRRLGYGVDEQSGDVRGLSLAAFYFLFSGGALTSTGSRGIDIDEARRVRRLIPLVGVFGGAMGNSIMPGKIKIGKAIPICQETMHLLPSGFQRDAPSIWDYLQEEMYTRKDDEKNENLRALIAPEVRGLLETAHRQEALKKRAGDAAEDVGQKQQMRYFVETFAAGTPFYWKIVVDDADDVEFEALITALVEFSRMPYVGGKSNVGLGEVSITFDNWMAIDSRVQANGQALMPPIGTRYIEHLRANGQDIRDLLAGMR